MTEPSSTSAVPEDLLATAGSESPPPALSPSGRGRLQLLLGGVGRRLLVRILFFSSLITLLLTALQLYLDYRRDVDVVAARVEQIRGSYHDSIARSLWSLDVEQLRMQIEGIARLPDVKAVTVQETAESQQRPLKVSVGRHSPNARLVWIIPIAYSERGTTRHLGSLTIEGSLDTIYARLADRTLVILASQGVKTFLVSFFILFMVYSLVTRHLVRLARHMHDYDVRHPEQNGMPVAGHGADDELGQMYEAFNGLQKKLADSYADLRITNEALQRDIEARKSAEAQAAYLAYHDALTGLANRRLLRERLEQETSLAVRLGRHGALVFVDLDHFQRLNDALGHSVGDALLREVAQRLGRAMRSTDLVARSGGDEFMLLLTGLGATMDEAAHAALRVTEALHKALTDPYLLGEQQLHVGISMGVALFPADGEDAEALLANVDSALHHAKAEDRNSVHFFQPEMQAAVQTRHSMETELREALAKKQFALAYQAQVGPDGALLGAEALIRWTHPVHGPVSPAEFIPVAEESGLIVEIGNWVMATATAQLCEWNLRGWVAPGFALAINVSPLQFHRQDFVDRVEQELKAGGIEAGQLILEITEGLLIRDAQDAVRKMHALRALRVKFHIDDFGTGYSSMSYLKRLPVDGIKIDQSFVREMINNPEDTAIIEAILAVASRFDLHVIAEGVETAEQLARLRELGCSMYQGYFFSRPIPADDFASRFLCRAAGADFQ